VAGKPLDQLAERSVVLKVPVHSVNQTDIPEIVEALLEDRRLHQVVMLRWWDFMRVRVNRELRRCVVDAALVLPVSRSVSMSVRFLRHRRPPRHMPFEMTVRLLGALEDRKKSIYLLGGTAAALRTVEQNLRETFPGLRFVGRYTGTFNRGAESDILTAIRKSAPDILLVGSGVAGGNRWISTHRSELPAGIALYSSEAFEIFAERRTRTSRTAFKRGLDFVPDLLRRPWRLLRFPIYLWFLLVLLVARIFRR
jgi:N-acetylglucosaminyldiphosphoundecaprenol N-acetyl-beta-D-mannosaminyltransferase